MLALKNEQNVSTPNSLKKSEESAQSMELDVVIQELERSLSIMESNYKKAVTNLHLLKERVETDDLTKLLRRRAFMMKLQSLMDDSRMSGQDVHLMMIDLDHFKNVNDTHGHQTGDDVLSRVSALIKDYLKPVDIAGRFGGEEIIVAVQASFSEAVQLAENIREAVRSYRMKSVAKDTDFQVTLSIGVTSAKRCEFDAKFMIAEADRALYQAKNSGRDRVIMAE